MKKKVLLIMGLCIVLLAGGCTKNGAKGNLSGTDSDGTDTVVSGAPVKEDYNVSDYIKLGNYKGLEITVDKLVVTDADVEAAITTDLNNSKKLVEITDRDVVETGDVANIDFEGLKDGVAFDGGAGTNYDLEIGSGSFIPGFEEGLVGKKVGEKASIDLTFPDDYQQADLAGQAVVFNVTVNKIQKYEIPELTEDYVKANTDYDSIDAYREGTRKSLETENEQSMNSDISNKVINAVVSDSTISSYPQTLIDFYSASYKSYVTQMLYYNYGMTVDQYIQQTGTTQEDFDANVKSIAENYSGLELAERAIAKAEGMKITDKDYTDEIDVYLEDYGVTTEEDLLKYMTKDQVKDDMLLKKALNFAIDNAVVTKNEVTPTPAVTEAPSATVTPAAK